MSKNIFPQINIKKLDSDISSWMRSGISASVFEKRINQDFYILAYQITHHLVNKYFTDDVPDIVTDVMSDFIEKLREGIIPFKAKSKFSTYLYSAVSNKVKDKYKTYYPSEIKRMGSAACCLYKLILAQNYEHITAVMECHQKYNTGIDLLKSWLNIIESYRGASDNRMVSQGHTPPEVSLDRKKNPDNEKESWEPASDENLQEQFIKKEISRQLKHAVELLTEPEKTAVIQHYFDGKTFKEIERENMNIKNAQYAVRRGEKQLKKIMSVRE